MKISIAEIYKQVTEKLDNKFKYKIYSSEDKEGLKNPSFFVAIKSKSIESETRHTQFKAFRITITYFQDIPSQIDNFNMIDQLIQLYGNKLHVHDRYLNIDNFDYDFVGKESDKLQFYFDVEFYDEAETTEQQHEIAGEIIFNLET